MLSKEEEIKKFLLNQFHSCFDTALKFDLMIHYRYLRCGNCSSKHQHPCSCGTAIKMENLKLMLVSKEE
jgi:hypothetical protein